MDTAVIVMALLVISVIAFIPVIIKRPKEVAELEKENARLEELIQNREDLIEDLREQLAKNDQL